MMTPQYILDFWFSDRVEKLWFNSNPEFDEEIKQKYESIFQSVMEGKMDDWMSSPQGALALVIILDQFPLNMYRGQAKCFEGEAKSRDVASIAVEKDYDSQLNNSEKAFLYMPFMHSENIEDQNKAVELFAVANLIENLRFAHHHRDIVSRFDRFPHRNAILGRENTPEEEQYLSSKEAFLG